MKPWNEEVFREKRPHLAGFVDKNIQPILDSCKRILVHAPVKSGKREMIEYIAVSNPFYSHVMISSWYRKVDNDQRAELEQHGLAVFTITNEKTLLTCLDWIKREAKTRRLVIHLDECDYGSGDIQSLSVLWAYLRDRFTNILYSATPEEILCSSELTEGIMEDMLSHGTSVVYTPPEGYCGPAKFLKEGLVEEATEFFHDTSLTVQGSELLRDMRKSMELNPRRNILILRLSYGELGGKLSRKENKAFYRFLKNLDYFPELEGFHVIADKDETSSLKGPFETERVDWSNQAYWDKKGTGPILIVIDQTSSRSTEWACHDRVYATHDYRHQIKFSTVSQAQERVNHYSQKYGGFQPIRVFGSMSTFKLSARQIDYASFYNPFKWKLKETETGFLVCSSDGMTLHPTCPPRGLPEDQAEDLIRTYKKHSLSMRVHGSAKIVPMYEAVWHPFTPESWDTEWPRIRDTPYYGLLPEEWVHTHNPFTTASLHRLSNGTWRGYHRGWVQLEWKNDTLYEKRGRILQKVDTAYMDRKPRKKICYHDGQIGVLFLFARGEEYVETLRPVNSMYGSAI